MLAFPGKRKKRSQTCFSHQSFRTNLPLSSEYVTRDQVAVVCGGRQCYYQDTHVHIE